MIDNLYCFVKKISSGKTLVILFIMVVIFILIPDYNEVAISPLKFEEYTHGLKMLDQTFIYSPEKAYQLISGYGEMGRWYYLHRIMLVDIFIPILVALFSVVIIHMTFQNLLPKNNMFKALYIVPFIGALLDYCENISTIILVISYPKKFFWVAILANIFTMSKMFFETTGLILAVFCAIAFVINKIYKAMRHSE